MLLPASAAFAAEPQEVATGALASVGESVGGAEVTGVEVHPEYERYRLRGAQGGELVLEVVLATPDHEGLCDVDGVTLFPRPELVTGAVARVDGDAWCERLRAHAPALHAVAGAVDDETTTRADPARVAVGLLAGVTGVLVAAAVWRARAAVDRGLAAVGVVAVALAAWGWPGRLFNAMGAGYEKLWTGFGEMHASPYGEGYAVTMAPAVALLGETPAAVFGTNLALGVAAAVAMWALVRGEVGARAAVAGGLVYATLPVALRLQASEDMGVPVAAYTLAALAAAGRYRRTGDLVAGFAAAGCAGMAVHTRPEAVPVAGLVAAWMLPRRAWGPWAVLGGAVVWRLATFPTSQGVLHPDAWARPSTWFAMLRPRWTLGEPAPAFQVFWHAAFTPVLLWPLVLLGLRHADRATRLRVFVWVGLVGGPLYIKAYPLADALRLQLPVQGAWLLLAAIGLARVPRWVLPVVLVAAGVWAARAPVWPVAQEFAFLRATVPTLPGGRTVRFDGTPQRAKVFGQVMETLGPARWSPTEGTLQYVGLSCFVGPTPPGCVPEGCPVATTRLLPPTDQDAPLPDSGVEIGFWGACAD